MIGPPGSGKTMLAKRLPTILPEMTLEEALETTKVHSVMGLLEPHQPLQATRPFRTPHHTISDAGLVDLGLYQKDVARFLGVTTDTVNYWEKERVKPRRKRRAGIEAFLGISSREELLSHRAFLRSYSERCCEYVSPSIAAFPSVASRAV
jgi:GTPase SAR1 family protein